MGNPHKIVIIYFSYLIIFFSANTLQNLMEITSVDNNNFLRTTSKLDSKKWIFSTANQESKASLFENCKSLVPFDCLRMGFHRQVAFKLSHSIWAFSVHDRRLSFISGILTSSFVMCSDFKKYRRIPRPSGWAKTFSLCNGFCLDH